MISRMVRTSEHELNQSKRQLTNIYVEHVCLVFLKYIPMYVHTNYISNFSILKIPCLTVYIEK